MQSNLKRMTAHSILLFGGFGAYALYAIRSANRRGATPSDKRYPLAKGLAIVAVGLLTYGVLLSLHPYLFGVSPLS